MQVVFNCVRELWKHLWPLQSVHREAVSLLHSWVFHMKQPSPFTLTYRGFVAKILNIYPPILTLLAAAATKMVFNPSMVFVKNVSLSCLTETGIFSEYNNLVKIDTTFIDFGSHTDFLVCLLPCCYRLTTLILGSNVSPQVLLAAKHCPLQILSIGISSVFHPITTIQTLTEIMLGIHHSQLEWVMTAYMRGEPVRLSSTWPNLTEFTMQCTSATVVFLTLVLVVHPNLKVLVSSLFPAHSDVKLYSTLREILPSLPKLSLKFIMTYIGEFQELYPYYPKLQKVSLIVPAGMEGTVENFFRLSCHLPNFTQVRLTYTGPMNTRPLPKTNQFQDSMRQITVLELGTTPEGYLEAWWVVDFLRQFPGLKALQLRSNYISNRESDNPWVGTFNSVTYLQCRCSNTDLMMNFLRMFPGLSRLNITCSHEVPAFPWKNLQELKELRKLDIFACKLNNILDLCTLPRETPDDTRWTLQVAESHVPEWVAKLLQDAGWTVKPWGDMPLFYECSA